MAVIIIIIRLWKLFSLQCRRRGHPTCRSRRETQRVGVKALPYADHCAFSYLKPAILILSRIQPWSSPPSPSASPWAPRWVSHSLQLDLFCPSPARGHSSHPRTASYSEHALLILSMHLYSISAQSSFVTKVTQTILEKGAGSPWKAKTFLTSSVRGCFRALLGTGGHTGQ